MSERDPFVKLLSDLDRPAKPSAEFADALRTRLLAELADPDGAAAPRRVRRPHLTPPRWRLLVGAAALALVAAASATVLLLRPSPASALEVVQHARQQFTQLPAFRATIVVKNSGLRIVYRRFYRDPNAWRSEVTSAIDPTRSTHAGDFNVWDGHFRGFYQAATHRFNLFPAAQERAGHRDRMATEDLDPHFYSWPGPTGGTRLRADQFFKRRCKVLPNDVVAGREARHLRCDYGPYGKPGGPNATISVWLDSRYGFILKLLGPVGSRLEVRKITLNPTFPAGAFRVQAPHGSKVTWGGAGPVPPALRQKVTPRLAASIPVGSHPAPLAAGAGSLWVANLGDGSLTRIDATSNKVISTIKGLHAYGLTYAAGSAWVITNGGRLERIDPASNRPAGPAIAVGGGTTAYRALAYGAGTLWTVGGKQRTVRFPDGMTDPNYASLVRVDPASGRVVADIPIQADLLDVAVIAVGEGSTWVATPLTTSMRSTRLVLLRVDPEHNRVVDTLDLGHYAVDSVVPALGSIWVTIGNQDQPGYLIRVDPRTDRIIARIRVGEVPAGIAVSPGAIWVANLEDGTLTKIDPATNRVIEPPTPIGDIPTQALYAYNALWVADNQDNTVVRINQADLP